MMLTHSFISVDRKFAENSLVESHDESHDVSF